MLHEGVPVGHTQPKIQMQRNGQGIQQSPLCLVTFPKTAEPICIHCIQADACSPKASGYSDVALCNSACIAWVFEDGPMPDTHSSGWLRPQLSQARNHLIGNVQGKTWCKAHRLTAAASALPQCPVRASLAITALL